MSTRARRFERSRALLAGGMVLGLLAGSTAAAFTDEAIVPMTAVGGLYDLAFQLEDGSINQGNPEAWEIDTTSAGPIRPAGVPDPWQIELMLANVGTTDAGTVTLTLESLLGTPAPDGDGVARDPFDVLLVSMWIDGSQVVAAEPASSVSATVPDWASGAGRRIVIELTYPVDLDTPYYYGKDVRLGLSVSGIA